MQKFKRILSMLLIVFFVSDIFTATLVFADKIYLKNGKKHVGITMGEDGTEVFFQLAIKTLRIPVEDVEKIEKWSDKKNARLERLWFWTALPARFLIALFSGPDDLKQFFIRLHRRIFGIIEGSAFYKWSIKQKLLRTWKKKHRFSFELSMYCVHLFFLALIVYLIGRFIAAVKEWMLRASFYNDN